jgi:alpha-ketoglutarate-dependent taurine dioxygenase
MGSGGTEARRGPGLGTIRRRAVDVSRLVDVGSLNGGEPAFPLLIQPAVGTVDLAAWAADNREQIDEYLDRHGAILFRGFGLEDVEDFEPVASAIVPDLFAEYGDLPPEGTSERVYQSTPYPPDKMILFHNESSHLPQWPMRQFFFCVTPSQEGGTTPILDCRSVCDGLDPEIVEEFERKGLMYVRNFSTGIDVPWQEFFKTSDRAEVEQMCTDSGMACEWTANDGLRIRQLSRGVTTHPRTGERIFFNQVQLHHVSCLDAETRESLRQLFAEEDMPRNVYYGDGSPIPDETMSRIGEVYEELCVEFPWQKGDLIVLDNMLVAHARREYVGPRKILVAMGAMVEDRAEAEGATA